ncbi:MAG: hypothetical protein Q9212_001489 [Teloschistes hypoglaucus]
MNIGASAITIANEGKNGHQASTVLESRQVSGFVGNEIFMRRAWQAFAGNFLYIDGGEISYKTSDPTATVYQYSSTTLSIDLSQDWRNDTVLLKSTNKPSGAPLLSSPSFWYDARKDVFYSGFAGRTSPWGDKPSTPPLSLWSFKPDGLGGGTWTEAIADNDPIWKNLTRPFDGYLASGVDKALVFGGAANRDTDPQLSKIIDQISLPGLVEFDFTTKKFTNSSTNIFGGEATSGQMHYVPSFGPDGVFLTMGGANQTDNQNFDFDKIWVYDTKTRRLYNQTTTGNMPEPRREFCTAGVNSTNGTYEIFVYGGYNGNLGFRAIPYDEVYVLSLPAFYWFKVDYPPQHPRDGHTCNAVGGSQIVTVGGQDANAKIGSGRIDDIHKSALNSSTDPFAQGLAIFDMTTLTWSDHFSASSPPYAQSDVVRNYYSQNPKGAIAGGVVGGVVGVVLIAGLAYCLRRRRQRQRNDITSKEGEFSEPSLPEAGRQNGYYAPPEKPQELHDEPIGPAEMSEARPEMGESEIKSPQEMDARGPTPGLSRVAGGTRKGDV